ncbi:MAG: polysaccharide biosynthesis/export family protein [Kiritimatiellales bacterium]|nr:polysaccharide biosynthesis/export family protein [Kiritimatiellales bacterium]
MICRITYILILLVTVLSTGCITVQPVTPGAAGSGVQATEPSSAMAPKSAEPKIVVAPAREEIDAYRLKPLDPVMIRFSGIREQQVLDIVIDENGEINLLHLKPIKAAGMTTSELERTIEKSYVDEGIYKTVSVNVTMTSKTYFIQGEVSSPGQFPLEGGTTLLQAIAAARGYTPYASDKITITRNGRIYKYDKDKLEKDPSKDVKIEAGDMIKVWQSWY